MRLKKSILALTLTTALLATSCAAQKKAVEESHTEAQSSAQLHTQETTLLDAATAAMVERMVEEQIRRLWENKTTTDEATERITEIFDTTQPTDSATGTPPLLSRTTERREARQTSESREQTEATKTDSTKAENNTDLILAETALTQSEHENRKESDISRVDNTSIKSDALTIIIRVMLAVLLGLIWWAVLKVPICNALKTVHKWIIKVFSKPD